MIRAILSLSLLLFAACGKVTTNIPSATAAPPELVGEWTGTWSTTAGDQNGALTMRVQVFAGQAVVQIDTNLPCVAGTSFQLQFQGTSFSASVGGQQILQGSVTAPSAMAGTFNCAAGTGTWQASRVRALPPVTDLSGVWNGALYRDGATPLPFVLDLQMTLDSGVLRLDGTIAVQGEPTATILGYAADFETAGYQVFFETADGALRAQGNGLYGPLRVETGQWGAFAAGSPIGGGVFAMDRQTP